MNIEIMELTEKFKKIKKLGWTKSLTNRITDVGSTLEYLLNIQNNELPIPDYNGIEIKAKTNSREKYIGLFNYRPESKYYLNNQRLKDSYGYPDKDYPNFLILNNAIFGNKKTIIGNKYKFQLNIDRNEEKIYLEIFDINDNLIEKETFWDFEEIKEKLNIKLTYLAIFKADRKKANDCFYYKYYMMTLYKLKGFNYFIEMIDKGYIRINFKIGIHKDNKNFGKIYDHGTSFEIEKSHLTELFDTIQKVY